MNTLVPLHLDFRALEDPDGTDVQLWADAYNGGGRAVVTPDEVRRSMRECEGREIRLLALRQGSVVGIGRAIAPGPARPDGMTYLFVRPALETPLAEAIGDAILAELARWVHDHAPRRCSAWIRDDEAGLCGTDFWTHHGFEVAARELVVGIDPRSATAPSPTWRVVSLAQQPGLIEQAYEVYAATFGDMPMVDHHPPDERSAWIDKVTTTPERGLDHVFVALDGSDVVGVGMLERQLARPGVAWHEMLGVRREQRGRGVATAIKVAQLRWAPGSGLTELLAGNDEHNLSMRHINARLGYEPRFTFVALAGEV